MRVARYLLLIFLLVTPMTSGAADYYFADCQSGAIAGCVAGNDANSGNSPANAKRTLGHLISLWNNASCGDRFYLARGGSWSTSSASFAGRGPGDCRTSAQGGSSSNLVVDDFIPSWATANDPRPQLHFSTVHRAIHFDAGGSVFRGLQFNDLIFECDEYPNDTGCDSSTGVGVFSWTGGGDTVTHVEFTRVRLDGFSIGIQYQGTGSANVGDNGIFQDGEIWNADGQGILGQGDSSKILRNHFDNNGHCQTFCHNVYVARSTALNTNMEFSGNLVTNPGGAVCDSVIVGPIGGNGTVARDNLIIVDLNTQTRTPECYGFSMNHNNEADAGLVNGLYDGNRFINTARGIECQACNNSTIQNNVMIGISTIGIQVSNGNPPTTLTTTGVTVRNNSCYLDSNVPCVFMNTNQGSGHSVANNAAHYTNSGTVTAYRNSLPHGSIAHWRNNHAYAPNATTLNWIDDLGTPRTLASWQAQGFGQGSILGVDPQFASPGPPNFDLSIPESSPLVDAALASNSPSGAASESCDVQNWVGSCGLHWPRDAAPDIGAFEGGRPSPPVLLDP